MSSTNSAVTSFAESWMRFFGALQSFLSQLENTEHPNSHFCEYAVDRLELWISTVSQLVEHLDTDEFTTDFIEECIANLGVLLRHMRVIRREWEHLMTDVGSSSMSYTVGTIHGETGRPRYCIYKEQLQYLRSMSFSWVQIATLLGVSYSTVYRRRMEFGLVQDSIGQTVDDATLIALVNEIRRQQPALGQTMVWGQLRSQGYHVTRARVRSAIRSTDPINTALRWHDNYDPKAPLLRSKP